ncbi:MAG: hypothetical protein V2A65_09110 [Candidatus Omnitrophota bacterium]
MRGTTTRPPTNTTTPTSFPRLPTQTAQPTPLPTAGVVPSGSRKYLSDDTTWKITYYLYDGLGNVRQLVDKKGSVMGSYDYEPFGLITDWKGGYPFNNLTGGWYTFT